MDQEDKDQPSFDIDDLAADVDLEEVAGDEIFDIDSIGTSAWLVKVPRFLAERWSEHSSKDGPGTELGRMIVHPAGSSTPNKIEIVIPAIPEFSTVPLKYDLEIRNQSVSNMFAFNELSKPEVIAEKEEDDVIISPLNETNRPNYKGKTKAKARVNRKPKAVGQIAHEAIIKPVIDDAYRSVMRARREKASQPKRTIKSMTEDVGTLNRMASGVASGQQAARFATLVKAKASKAAGERFARMPKSELLDQLFMHFKKYRYWSMKSLRDNTRQPEAYLREVLLEVADLIRQGPYSGHWVLKETYRNLNNAAQLTIATPGSAEGAEGGTPDNAATGTPASVPAAEEDGVDDDDDEMEMEQVV